MDVFAEFDSEKTKNYETKIIDSLPLDSHSETGNVIENISEALSVETKEESVPEVSEDLKRKEHEEKEAQRKAEWEKKQQEKKYEELKALQELRAMTDDDAISKAVKKAGSDAERITRRNMKICVTEHIQTKCLEDTMFARQTIHPRKNMINCFKYITRHAYEYIKQSMEENDETQSGFGMGDDVPDELCYKWAEEYFFDMDAKEDQVNEEKFIPKLYLGKSSSKSKKKETKKKEPAPKVESEQIQLTLEGVNNI